MRALLVIAVIVVLAAIVLFAKRTAQPNNVAVLSNGVRIEFLGATTAGASFTTEKPWHKALRKVLPPQFQSWIPRAMTGGCSSGSNSVTMHFYVTDPAGPNRNPPWQNYEARDEDGQLTERDGGYCSSGWASNSTLYSLSMRNVPRRQKTFTFNFLDSHKSPVASFQVPNPVKGPFPQWTPSPVPQTKTNDPVVLTLESLQLAGREPPLYVRPKWKITSDDPLWAKARARSYTLLDATGNEGQMLSTNEPAWLVRATVHREQVEEFTSKERLSITNLAVPGPGEFIELDQTFVVSGVEVKLLVFAGPGDFVVSNGVRSASAQTTGSHSTSSSGTWTRETWGGTKPFLLVEVIGAQDGDELRVRPTHDAKAKFQDSGYYGRGKRTYRLPFNAAADEKTISFNVILSRPRFFDFIIDPKVIQPPAR
jgi:hypothetical protein